MREHAVAAGVALTLLVVVAGRAHGTPLGLGEPAPAALIEAWDVAIGPHGAELPPGRGSVADGAVLYARHCAACHGAEGRAGPDAALAGGHGTLAGPAPQRTVGSYWPYATTLYDYVRRAMPFFAPGSLAADAVYALTAHLLHLNGIVAADAVMDRDSLPAVRMPNRDGFVPDPRPDVAR